jgi:proteasome lid subunit RPN8/RPN11
MPKSKKQCEISKPEEKYQVQLDSLQVELEQANRDNNVESCGGIRTKKKKKALNEVEVVEKRRMEQL